MTFLWRFQSTAAPVRARAGSPLPDGRVDFDSNAPTKRSCGTAFASLDPKDRKLLLICLSAVVVLAAVMAFFGRNQNSDDNTVPSSYLTGRHGARAAYEMLQSSGYNVQRWEDRLSSLATQTDETTVVILAEPIFTSTDDVKALREIVARGGRVLLTGFMGGELAPGGDVRSPMQFQAACKLTPQGLDPLAASGEVWMVPEASWGAEQPRTRVQYNCIGAPSVVEYNVGKGRVVWWASSTPLENGSIARANDLNLFLNALGPRDGHKFYVVFCARAGADSVDRRPDRNRASHRPQLQPPQRAVARFASAGAGHAGGVS